MTLVMSYVILLAAVIGACGAALEGALERKTPRRWIWLSSLAATLVVTALAMVWPMEVSDPGVGRPIDSSALVLSEQQATSLTAMSPAAAADITVLTVADTFLPYAWLLSSAGLLLAIVFGQRRLRRERLRAQPTELAGQPALVSETIGPAVAGLRAPVVFVPKWVLALDEPSQHLLMAHEMEHVRKRDTAMLFAGALGVALTPWNPVVWWMVRRLRLAVEQDCDARVLAANPGVRRYADLLLLAASRPSLTTRLLAAHFGEHSSDLVRRIDTMTRQSAISWRRIVPATAIASLLLAAACETPRPAPVAPIELRTEDPTPTSDAAVIELERKRFEERKDKLSQIGNEKFSVLVFSSDGTQLARYSGEIPVAHLPQDGVQNVKADEFRCGTSECYAVRITLKPGFDLNFTEIAKANLLKLDESRSNLQEFKIPAVELTRDSSRVVMTNAKLKAQGESLLGPVEALVEKVRRLSKVTSSDDPISPDRSAQGDEKLVLYHLADPNAIGPVPPNVIVYNSDGTEIARFSGPGRAMREIALFGVESIKDQKTGDCSPLACPLSRITLKPGFKLMSYQEWERRK